MMPAQDRFQGAQRGFKLSLADLLIFDSGNPQRASTGRERRFLCPLCGEGKPKDAAHRSLCADTQSGVWHCHRCNAGGKLLDVGPERPSMSRRESARARLRRACDLPPVDVSVVPPIMPIVAARVASAVAPSLTSPTVAVPHQASELRAQLHALRLLRDTPGMAYLEKRGVPLEMAHQAGVRFLDNWAPSAKANANVNSKPYFGGPAVVFSIRDRAGTLVAAQGRYIAERAAPKTRSAGAKQLGIFGTPGAWEMPTLLITEAPLDALSLTVAGYPAIALCGTSGPAWLPRACFCRRVLLALDADAAGDGAAAKLSSELASFGARCQRLRPEGGKDWNELLLKWGQPALSDWLAPRILLEDADRLQLGI